MLKEHFLYECDKVAQKIRETEKQALPPWGADPDWQSRDYVARAQAFGARLQRQLKQLSNLYSIEKRVSVRVNPAESDGPETDQLTIAQCVWAAHYLLLEAGLSYATVDKTIVARFISALTGYGFENVYKRVRDKHGKNEKQY